MQEGKTETQIQVAKAEFDQLKDLVFKMSDKLSRLERANIQLKTEIDSIKTAEYVAKKEREVASKPKPQKFKINYIPVQVLVERYVEVRVERIIPREIYIDKIHERIVERSPNPEKEVKKVEDVLVEVKVHRLNIRDVVVPKVVEARTEDIVSPYQSMEVDEDTHVEDRVVEVLLEKVVPIEVYVDRYFDLLVERLVIVDVLVEKGGEGPVEIVEQNIVPVEYYIDDYTDRQIESVEVIDKVIEKQM